MEEVFEKDARKKFRKWYFGLHGARGGGVGLDAGFEWDFMVGKG